MVRLPEKGITQLPKGLLLGERIRYRPLLNTYGDEHENGYYNI